MTTKEATHILRRFNLWRRAIPPYDAAGAKLEYTSIEIGIAIDTAVAALDKL